MNHSYQELFIDYETEVEKKDLDKEKSKKMFCIKWRSQSRFFQLHPLCMKGEFVEKQLKKGTKMLLSSRIQKNNYTNSEAQKVSSVQIIREELQFTENKNRQVIVVKRTPSSGQRGFTNLPDCWEEEGIPFTFSNQEGITMAFAKNNKGSLARMFK